MVAAVAALPVDRRISVVARLDAPEGTWVISRLPSGVGGEDCVLGDPASVRGRDFVCDAEYGELVLMSRRESEVLRAFPFPGVRPQTLLLTAAAVYCGRQGDGALPNSMLCRIDRSSLGSTVRVFASPLDSGFAEDGSRYVPASWAIDHPPDLPPFGELAVVDGAVVMLSSAGVVRFQPDTLELMSGRSG